MSNIIQINIEMDDVDSTLFNVVNFNVDVNSVVSRLIWRCAMLRRHINPKTTLKRRWNVCWGTKSPFQKQKFVLNTRKLKKNYQSNIPQKVLLYSNDIKYFVKDCGFVFVFNSWNSRFSCFFLSTSSALNDVLHNYDFVMIIMQDFSATKESPNRSFHTDISKMSIQKIYKRANHANGKSMYMQKQTFCEKDILRRFCEISRKISVPKSLF